MGAVLIVAGENSGEFYGAELVRQMRVKNPSVEFFGIGGTAMKEAGVEILFPIEDLAVMGVFELVADLTRILRILRTMRTVAKKRKPQAAVLIDSPDFNLRLAKTLKRLSIPVLYYISPTVWAWRKSRMKTIKKIVKKMLLIFPFEERIYKEHKILSIYVGHPIKEKIRLSITKENFFSKYNLDPQKKLIALLPGSRKTEIRYHMPVLVKAVNKICAAADVQFILRLSENLNKELIAEYSGKKPVNIPILAEDGYEAMAYSDLVISCCGTANLEAALLKTPLVAFYKLSSLSYNLGIWLVRIRQYSIVNILAGKTVVPELIQKDFTAENISRETLELLNSPQKQKEMLKNFKHIGELLGDQHASQNAAAELDKLIKSETG